MEEILASIRKIISEDSNEGQPAAAPETRAAPPHEADVLELTQEVHDEPAAAPVVIAAPPPPPEPVQVVSPEPEPAAQEDDVVFQSIEEVAVSEPQTAMPLSQHEGIFTEKTRKALEDSFASIHKPAEETPAATAAPVAAAAALPAADGTTVQAVFEKAVRESFDPVFHQWLGANSDAMIDRIKPLIREWMDAHFPALLEGAVRAEVERVARARH
jgi:cell pole-organizing protein PopZ